MGLLNFLECFLNSNGFDFVGGLANASRVYKAESNSFYNQFVFNGVTRGSCYGRNNGAIFVEQGVEQGRFTHIGFAHNGYRNAVFDYVSDGKGINQAFQDQGNAIDQGVKLGSVGKGHVFFGKIQFEFNQGSEIE